MPASFQLNGESRRSTQAYDAAMGDAHVAPLGINPTAHHLINNKDADSGRGHIGEGEKLTEHTIVHPRGCLRQVTVTIVMHAVGALRHRCRSAFLMHMERRAEQHWQKDCQ